MRTKLFVFAWLLISAAAEAQVYRCEAGGKVTFTDAPCGSGAVRSRDLPSPPPQALPSRIQPATETPVASPNPRPEKQAPEPASCPSELDIKNIHTRLSARVVPAKNTAALHTELAKAERCARIGGRYSYDDWQRLQAVLRGDD